MAPTRTQYRLVQAIPLIPTGIAFICSWWMSDTPRWLASQDRYDEALASLARLRGSNPTDESVREEFEQIEAQRREKAADLAATSLWNVIKEITTVPTYRSRYLLVMTMQTVAQWSGGNGITVSGLNANPYEQHTNQLDSTTFPKSSNTPASPAPPAP